MLDDKLRLADAEMEALILSLSEADMDADIEGLSDGETDGEREADIDADGDWDNEILALSLGLSEALGLCDAEILAEID